MLHSIRWRLVLSYTLLTLLTVSLLGILVLSLVQRYITRQENAWLTANASALARHSPGWLGPEVPRPELERMAQTMALLGNVQVRFLNADKQLLADSGVPATEQYFYLGQQPGQHRGKCWGNDRAQCDLSLSWPFTR